MTTPRKATSTRSAAKRSSRPAAIMKISDVGLDYINMGIYSHPGMGKTVFIGTHPNILVLDCDSKGVTSAAALGSKGDCWRIMDYTDLEEAYQYLRNGGTNDYDFVWWDSVTLFQDRTLYDELLRDAYEKNPSNQDPDVPSKREYFKSQKRIGTYMRQFVELPINFGVSFHVGTYENPNGDVQWCPLLQGGQNMAFSTKMQGYLNIVGYYYAKEEVIERNGKKVRQTTRYLRTRANEEYVAKDRFNILPAILRNPTLPDLQRRIKG